MRSCTICTCRFIDPFCENIAPHNKQLKSERSFTSMRPHMQFEAALSLELVATFGAPPKGSSRNYVTPKSHFFASPIRNAMLNTVFRAEKHIRSKLMDQIMYCSSLGPHFPALCRNIGALKYSLLGCVHLLTQLGIGQSSTCYNVRAIKLWWKTTVYHGELWG